MQIHLDKISKQIQDEYYAIILMDRASWHTTEVLIIPERKLLSFTRATNTEIISFAQSMVIKK